MNSSCNSSVFIVRWDNWGTLVTPSCVNSSRGLFATQGSNKKAFPKQFACNKQIILRKCMPIRTHERGTTTPQDSRGKKGSHYSSVLPSHYFNNVLFCQYAWKRLLQSQGILFTFPSVTNSRKNSKWFLWAGGDCQLQIFCILSMTQGFLCGSRRLSWVWGVGHREVIFWLDGTICGNMAHILTKVSKTDLPEDGFFFHVNS